MFRRHVMQGHLNAFWRGRSLVSFEVDNTGTDLLGGEICNQTKTDRARRDHRGASNGAGLD